MAIVNSRFSQIAEQNRRAKTPLNLLVRVDKYNLEAENPADHYVEGVRVGSSNQDTVRIYLKQSDKNENQKQFSDYSNSENSFHVISTEQGEGKKTGVMMFENCVKGADNSFVASWVNPMINDSAKSRQRVSTGYSTLILRAGRMDPRTNEKKPNAAFLRHAMLEDSEAFALNQKVELLNFLKQAMVVDEGQGSYRPEVIVRIVDLTSDTPEVNATILTAPYIQSPNEGELPRLATPDEALDSFINPTFGEGGKETTKMANQLFQVLMDAIDNEENHSISFEEAFIEVVPVIRRNMRTQKTAESSLFEVKEVERDGKPVQVNGLSKYGESLLAKFIKRPEEGDSTRLWVPCTFNTIQLNDPENPEQEIDYQFVGAVIPNDVFPKGYEMSNLPTKHFTNVNTIKSVFGSDSIAVDKATNAAAAVANNDAKDQQAKAQPADTHPSPTQTNQADAKATSTKQKTTKATKGADLSDNFENLAGNPNKTVSADKFEDEANIADGMIEATQTIKTETPTATDSAILNHAEDITEDSALLDEMFGINNVNSTQHVDSQTEAQNSTLYSESSLDAAMTDEENYELSDEESALMEELFAQNNSLSMR